MEQTHSEAYWLLDFWCRIKNRAIGQLTIELLSTFSISMAVVSQFSNTAVWFALQICKRKARILASSRRTRVAQSSSLRTCTTSLVIEAHPSVHWSYHQGPPLFPYNSGVQRNTTGIRSECSSTAPEISSPACTPAVWAQIEPEKNNNDRFIARRSTVPRW